MARPHRCRLSHPRLQGVGYVRLGTATGTIVRKQEDGPLFLDSARQVDGRWVVPGVVGIFTSRGQRVLDVGAGATSLGGFIVPLPGHPEPRATRVERLAAARQARRSAASGPVHLSLQGRTRERTDPRRCGRTVHDRHDCHLLLQDVGHGSVLGALDVSRPLSGPAAARVGADRRRGRHRRRVAFPAPRGRAGRRYRRAAFSSATRTGKPTSVRLGRAPCPSRSAA